jgi:hypothetical protein
MRLVKDCRQTDRVGERERERREERHRSCNYHMMRESVGSLGLVPSIVSRPIG